MVVKVPEIVNSLDRCNNCSNIGHDVLTCYELLGICSYCREEGHHSSFPAQAKYTTNTYASCPFCKGNHFGKDSQSKGNSPCKSVGSTSQPGPLPKHQPREYSAQGAPLKDNNPFALSQRECVEVIIILL